MDGKASAYNVRDLGSIPVGKIPWRKKWQNTPVFTPGKSDAPRSLVGYSPWGCKEMDTTEQLLFTSLHLLQLKLVASHRDITWVIEGSAIVFDKLIIIVVKLKDINRLSAVMP